MDIWWAIERLSWLVAILGIPAIVVGLWALIRRPKIDIGFLPAERTRPLTGREALEKSMTIRLDPGPAAGFSTAHFNFLVVNRGRATARDLLINFVWPGDKDWASYHPIPKNPNADYQFDPVKQRPFTLVTREWIHPGDYHEEKYSIPVRTDVSGLEIPWEASMDDGRARGELKVTFAR